MKNFGTKIIWWSLSIETPWPYEPTLNEVKALLKHYKKSKAAYDKMDTDASKSFSKQIDEAIAKCEKFIHDHE